MFTFFFLWLEWSVPHSWPSWWVGCKWIAPFFFSGTNRAGSFLSLGFLQKNAGRIKQCENQWVTICNLNIIHHDSLMKCFCRVSCDKTMTISIIISAYSILSLQLCNSVIEIILESLRRSKSAQNCQRQKNSMTWSSCGVMLLFLWVQQVQLAETSSVATQGKKNQDCNDF